MATFAGIKQLHGKFSPQHALEDMSIVRFGHSKTLCELPLAYSVEPDKIRHYQNKHQGKERCQILLPPGRNEEKQIA
jgi:hypothetical protein